MVSLCPPKTFGLIETRVHAALAMPATLAPLGAIFQAFPALCPCEPRLPREEMQAVLCGVRSNTRHLPASTTQPLLLASALSGNMRPRYVFLFKQKRSLHSDTSSYPARER